MEFLYHTALKIRQDTVYEVVNDELGVYQDPYTEYRQISVPGIPGLVEVMLKGSTIQKDRYNRFATAPYPLRLRFFTNAGVREFEFAAPPVYKDYRETTAQAAERINNCKRLGHDLVTIKYLELLWRIDPPPDARAAQHWEIFVSGLEPGRKSKIWNLDSGILLGEFPADIYGTIDISLVISPGEFASSLLMGLDDVEFIENIIVRQLRERTTGQEEFPAPNFIARQTLLHELDKITFHHPVENLGMVFSEGQVMLQSTSHNGRILSRNVPVSLIQGIEKNFTKEANSGSNDSDILIRSGRDKRTVTIFKRGMSEIIGDMNWSQ